MSLTERISAFELLGQELLKLPNDIIKSAEERNSWFTEENVKSALIAIAANLSEEKISKWLSFYKGIENDIKLPKKIGIVMAGNIPMVGFHDLLCILLSGNVAVVKPSSKDDILPNTIVNILIEICSEFKKRVFFTENLNNCDAIIATGSDNTSRYFEYYFKNIPHIIRKNRSSVAILTGSESFEELQLLANDVFTYFGMGCRNVSKLFVPENYDFELMLKAFKKHEDIINHKKYYNNYRYNKSIFLINKTPHIDNMFFLITESSELTSFISVINYEYYRSINSINEKLEINKNKLQCIVSNQQIELPTVKFGQAQQPKLWDYADNVDTMNFLLSLS